MSSSAARWIFWVGTLVSLVLLVALTVDTHARFAALTHADRLDEHVVAGKHAFENHNCNDCHTILGFGSYYAPDLTRAYTRLGDSAVRDRLATPQVIFASSFRKMPQQHLSSQEIDDITSYLQWLSGIDNHDWPPQDSTVRWTRASERLMATGLSAGAALVNQANCLACHGLGKKGARTGPRMEWIGTRHDAEWIARYIGDPQKIDPTSQMPPLGDSLSQADRETIAEFIVAASKDAR